MIISFNTHPGGFELAQGYGTAGYNIVKSLQELGHQVPYASRTAPVSLNFTQPFFYHFNPGQYTIGYTPWESSKLMPTWAENMNVCDEVWTTSDLCAQWFKEDGVEKPIHIYEHGIDHAWAPKPREDTGTIRFLHVGEPAPRKCGQMVVDTFAQLFANNPDYHLTIKSSGHQTTRVYLGAGMLFTPDKYYNNVSLITESMDLPDLIDLHYQHDILIYPSYGEGFGFIPLQAAATGMPVIMNDTWAPYRKLITGPRISDMIGDTLWPEVHPGKMLHPSQESLAQAMLDAVDNIVTLRNQALEVAPQIHKEYDWKTVTSKAFKHILEKFE